MVENFCRKMNFTFFPDSSVETQGFNWTYLLMHIWLRACPRKKKNKAIQTGLGLGLEAQESRLLTHYQFCIHKVVSFPVRTTPHEWQHKKPKNSHHQANTNLLASPAPAHPELLRAERPCWAEALAPPARVLPPGQMAKATSDTSTGTQGPSLGLWGVGPTGKKLQTNTVPPEACVAGGVGWGAAKPRNKMGPQSLSQRH